MMNDFDIKYITGRHDLLENSSKITDFDKARFKSRWLEPMAKNGASMLLVNENGFDPFAFTWPLEINHHIYGKEDLFPASLSGSQKDNLKTVIDTVWAELGGAKGMRPPVQIVADGLNDFVYQITGRSLECALAVSCAALFSQSTPLKRFFITGSLEGLKVSNVGQLEEKLAAVTAIITLRNSISKSPRDLLTSSSSLSLPLQVVIPYECNLNFENAALQIHRVSTLDELLKLCFGEKPILSNFYSYDFSSIKTIETETYHNGKYNDYIDLEQSLSQKIDTLSFRLLQIKAYRCSVTGFAEEGMFYYGQAESIGHKLGWEKAGISPVMFYSRMLTAQRFLFEAPDFIRGHLKEMKKRLSEIKNPIEMIHFSGSISLGYVWLGEYKAASEIRRQYLEIVVKNYELDSQLKLEFARSHVYMALSEARAGNPSWQNEFKLSENLMVEVPDSEPFNKQKQNQAQWNEFNYLYCLYLIGDFFALFERLNEIKALIRKFPSTDYRHVRLLTFLVECFAANGETEKCPPLIEQINDCVKSKENQALTILPHLAELSTWVHFKPDENHETNLNGKVTIKTSETNRAIDHIRKKVSDLKKSFPSVYNLHNTEFELLFKPDSDHKAIWRKVIRRIPW